MTDRAEIEHAGVAQDQRTRGMISPRNSSRREETGLITARRMGAGHRLHRSRVLAGSCQDLVNVSPVQFRRQALG